VGLTIVTTALDTDIEAARPFHEAARPIHPSLVDPSHQLVELFGFTNIPFGLWVDEDGMIVRPSDVAFGPSRQGGVAGAPPDQEGQRRQEEAMNAALQRMTPEQRQAAHKMFSTIDRSGRYVDAIRDWVAKGSGSQYVLSPDEVVQRSRPRPPEFGMAAAEFELAQHLQRAGFGRDAVPHFTEAHRLDPANWSYFRQALAVAEGDWGQVYERGDVMSELAVVGPETFYPPLDL
jgi:hypothetical protein